MKKELKMGDSFPYGTFKGFEIRYRLIESFDYCVWWNNNVKDYPFDKEIKDAIKKEQFERWNREEKSYFERERKRNLNKKSRVSYNKSVDLIRDYDEDDGIIIGINGF